MPFRTSSGTFGPALCPGLSAGTLHHVILRGMDERILGSGPFVARMLAAGDARQQTPQARGHRLRQAQALMRQRCRREQVGLEELRMGSRRRRIAAVRARLAVDLVTRLGLSLADAARQLGVSTSGTAKALARAERL